MRNTRRGILYATAGFVVVGPLLVWFVARLPAPTQRGVLVPIAVARPDAERSAARPAASSDESALLELAERNPLALVERAQAHYEQNVHDYRCTLIKQELVQGTLTDVEEVEVRFRKAPLSIYMIWQKNASQAQRALYKPEDPDYVDEDGHKLARVEPAGSVVRMFVQDIFLRVNGSHARKASRRTIDECGFGPMFELFDKYTRIAAANGDLDLRFAGTSEVDGRPTLVIERRLPYSGPDGPYPDARLVMHIDQARLLPVAIETFADPRGDQLLGRYIFKDVELNVGLADEHFTF